MQLMDVSKLVRASGRVGVKGLGRGGGWGTRVVGRFMDFRRRDDRGVAETRMLHCKT